MDLISRWSVPHGNKPSDEDLDPRVASMATARTGIEPELGQKSSSISFFESSRWQEIANGTLITREQAVERITRTAGRLLKNQNTVGSKEIYATSRSRAIIRATRIPNFPKFLKFFSPTPRLVF